MKKSKHIPIKNVYYMLAYAFKTLKMSEFVNIKGEEFPNALDMIAAFLSGAIAQQLKQGLYREYLNRTEALPVMRGKLDMPGTIRLKLAHRQRLSCEYDELTENNLHNQILKTTANLLIRSDQVRNRFKNVLKKEMAFFSDVAEIDPFSVVWSKLRYDRNNQSYRNFLPMCQFVLKNLILTTEQGEYKLAKFIDERKMSALYESFIREYFIQEYPSLTVKRSQVKWALDKSVKEEDVKKLPTMQTDITISNRAGRVLIIDAKFYSQNTQERYFMQENDDDVEEVSETGYSKRKIHSHNLYQIFAYVKNKEAEMAGKPHNVSGILLYARTDEKDENQPNQLYLMSGNRIGARTLDLNQDFSVIAKQLDDIAEEFFDIRREAVAM